MHDPVHGRRYDRMLSAVAAAFLALSATSAMAQTAPAAGTSPAELAIDAAVPRPEPANVPPPTAADFKPDPGPATTASAPAVTPAPVAAAPTVTSPTASSPTEPSKAATSVASADQPVADKIRDLMSSKGARYFDRKGERTAAESFYKAREYAPVWTEGGAISKRGKVVIARLKNAASDGLEPNDYPVPDFAAATSPDALAEAEYKLTASVLDYARHAQAGRMHYSRISADILFPEHNPEPADVLSSVASSADPAAALDAFSPQHKGYKALKAKLAELRGEIDAPAAKIADGPVLKYTPAKKSKKQSVAEIVVEDARVPALRTRLGVTDNANDSRYDETVAAAVRKFQSNADIKVTGQLDEPTVRALNAPKRDKQIDLVRVNMERWRWLPRELGPAAIGNAHVMLNVPDFTLKVMHKGAQAWSTRVVVGKPGNHATPELTETMKFITVNPTWNVPPSIIYNEYLPALAQDPTVLQRMGLKLERARDGSIRISQPPGERNALGRIRFNFPNKFLVYQHDTPDKHLFANDVRAYSHGCMRVQNPDQYAEVLLGIVLPAENYTAAKIRGMYGSGERDIKFPNAIPVHITYQTAFVDDAGQLQIRKDIYGRDSRMLAILKGGEGRDMETVVSHAQPNYTRPRGNVPQGVAFNDSGPSFFERLFGGNQPQQPARPQRRVYTR